MAEQNKVNIIAGLHKAFSFEQITVSNAVKTLTVGKYTDTDSKLSKKVFISVEDAQIRYTFDGTTPTSSIGHIANPAEVIILIGTQNIENFKAIRKGSTDAKISVTYGS